MTEAGRPHEPVSSRFAQACGVLLCGIAMFTAADWASGWQFLAQRGTNYIPMAPSSALAVALLSAGLLAWSRWPAYRRARQFTACAAALGSGLAVLILLSYLGGPHVNCERFLVDATESFEGIPVGRMSPVTAIAVWLGGLALLASVRASTARRIGPSLVASLATCVTAIGSAVLLGYAYRMPLLYGGSIIPVALPTAVALLLLGLGLLAAGDRYAWPTRIMLGPSIRARLLRAFLPVTLALVLGENWLQVAVLPGYAANPVLWSSFIAVTSLAIIGGTVTLIARGIGGAMDRAEEALRLAHKELHHLLSHSPAVFYTLKLEGQTIIPLMVSDNIERLLGVTPAEATGFEWWLESLHPEDRDRMLSTMTREFARNGYSMEYRLRCRDGTYRWIEDKNRVLRDAAGQPTEVVGVWTDITERKQLQDAVALRERQLNSFFRGATAGLVLLDKDMRYLQINGTLAEMNGIPVEQHIGRTVREVMPGMAPAVEPILQQVLATGEPVLNVEVSGETPCQPGVQRHWMESFFPIVGADGSPSAVGAIVVETTEQKCAESRIRHLNDVLWAVRDIGELIVRERNADRLLADACNTLMRTRGYRMVWIGGVVPDSKRVVPLASAGPATDYLDAVAITWDESDRGRGPIGTALRERQTHVCQDTATSLDFAPWREQALARGYRSLAAVPMIYECRLFGAMAVYADHPTAFDDEELCLLNELAADLAFALQSIEDEQMRKQAEQDLMRAKVAAESANRAKSVFLANMSHEIRTPMTAILGYADLMAEESIGHDTREHLAVIKRNGEHLLQVINDILDLSKIEAEKLRIEPTCCWPAQLVAEVVCLMRPQAAAKRLTLKTELAHPLPETVFTDPSRLRQILVNLVGNAIKFTDQGEVRLAVRLDANSGRLGLCFDVTDTGIGMDKEQIGKLFQPFSQVDSSSTRKFGGTGLGLCISEHLAEAMGGNIKVRSELGKGSTFSVMIDPGPLDGVQTIANAQELAIHPPRAKPVTAMHGRILLAEDGLDNQRLIALLLSKAGAQVTAVENGQRAIEVVLASREAGEPFDVILMDMQMPVLDGYEATRQLRRRGYAGPILALTAHAMAEDGQKCLAAGCNDYLPKPFQHHALLEMVVRHITAENADMPRLPDDTKPAAAGGRTPNDSPSFSTGESQASTTILPAFLYSHLAADPDFSELVDLFVQAMPDRINALDAQAMSRNWSQLAETAHQIKGAVGCYGFDEITSCAARLEAAAREAPQEEQILSALNELRSLCHRVRSGKPGAMKPY